MAVEFVLPELGEGVDSADVARLFVSEGDRIEADQNIMELETEKAVADLPCPHAGKIAKVHVSEGDTIEVGQTLLTIEEVEAEPSQEKEPPDDETTDEPKEAQHEKTASEQADEKQKAEEKPDRAEASDDEEPAEPKDDAEKQTAESRSEASREPSTQKPKEKKAKPSPGGNDMPPPAGPATRRLARKLGVDIAKLKPTEGERIKQEDIVRAYVESGKAAAMAQQDLPDFERFGEVERQPLNKIARTAAQRLAASWRQIPHVTQHGLADITELEAARREFIADADDAQPKITLTALAVKAVVGVLKQLPKFNTSLDLDNGELVLKHYFHVGIAVDTEHGLLVPVVRDADRKNLLEIAAEIEQLALKARDRDLTQGDLQGGTFTISNQGGIGGGHFTPIVNWPEVAILGLGRAYGQLELHDDAPRERLKLPLSLSYDHRAINGADAARFISLLEEALSGAFELLIAS